MFNQSPKLEKLEKGSAEKRKLWLSLSYFRSYLSVIRISVFFNRLMGFLPFRVESSKLVYSKLYFVFSTISIIIYLVFALYSLYIINFIVESKVDISNTLHSNFLILFGPVIFVSACVKCRSVIQAINRISNVSYILSPENFREMAKIFLVKDTLLFTPLLIFLPRIFEECHILCFVFWYTFIGAILLIILYMNNVYVLNACFKHINDSLVKVKEVLINDEPHLLRRVYHMQKNPMLLTKLRTLKKQHLETSEAVQLLNHSFSTQIELVLSLYFVDVTFNIYKYVALYSGTLKIESFFYALCYAIFYTAHIIVIVTIIEITKSQIKKIGSNIHQVLVHTFDEQVTTELELFSLQVLQKGATFAMKGLVIDATFLTKISCGITTFLLILIQFLFIEPCSSKASVK